MVLLTNTLYGIRYKRMTYIEAIAYFLKGAAREIKIAPGFFLKSYLKIRHYIFIKKWLVRKKSVSYFDIAGAKLPDISKDQEKLQTLTLTFEDIFLIPAYFNDNFDKSNVDILDSRVSAGPYCYIDGDFDVTIKKGDIVIDAGAWIGEFSAYAVTKGAIAYAFEPVKETFGLLCQTADLNQGNIYPVQKGLGKTEKEIMISICSENSGANSIAINRSDKSEKITITTLDKFVEEHKLTHVDFIKADIEGAERDMLLGATNVLRSFAPKLALCTYHLPDDPEILEKIILNANPKYKVIHLKQKLMAVVI
jgi:FkbM family methyltransferase